MKVDLIIIYLPGILMAILSYICGFDQYTELNSMIKSFPQIGIFSFGFLLTMFSIIINSNNKDICEIKNNKILFSRFVNFNRQTVIILLILTLFSFVFGNINIDPIKYKQTTEILVCIFNGMFVTSTFSTIYFLIIFYKLIQSK